MIRILHSVSNMDRAGIETMLMNYYRNIDRSKIQFDFLCNKKKRGSYEEEIKSLGGKIYRTPGLNPLKFFQYMKYMKKLFKDHPEYKIIHAHNGAFGVYALYCARKANIPIRIFHGHNSGFPIDIKLPLKLFCKRKLKKNLTEKWGCGEQAVKFYYDNDTFKKNDYTIIHNAIDLDKFKFNQAIRDNIRNKYDLSDKTVIGHVGRFSPVKNHSLLINIFEEYLKINNNARLILIGDGENEEKIKKLVKNKNIDKKVIFLGNISNVNEWYQAFDLFILPSINEGLPVVGIEAQATGLPCLFSSTVPNEVDITGNSYFINLNEKPKSWASIIDNILNNYERKSTIDEIDKNGYNIMLEAKNLEKKYFKLYENEGDINDKI